MAKKITLSPPWVTYYRKINALFGEDPKIKVSFDADKYIIKLYVEGTEKADAISNILPKEKVFGNVTVKIKVIPANLTKRNNLETFKAAFKDSPVLSYTKTVDGVLSSVSYVVFNNNVVQFFNDDISDINGVTSTLYQDIARELFEDSGVFFCTDVPAGFGG